MKKGVIGLSRGAWGAWAMAASLGLALTALPVAAKDVAGSSDHPLVGRYQGAQIAQYNQKDFDEVRLPKAPLDLRMKPAVALTEANSLRLQGRATKISYDAPSGRSALEVFANHADTLKSKGFEPVFECANESCVANDRTFYRLADLLDQQNYYSKSMRYMLAKLAREQGDVYVALLAGEGLGRTRVFTQVVELKGMDSGKIAFVNASQMQDALAASGKVALYGILFDTAKADVRPESQTTLAEVAKFLNANPSVQLIVAGHTDNQGGFDGNVDLSRRRASAVVVALTTQHHISASRLTPFGAGMAAPVASNADESGRSKNRRVELVLR